MRWEIALMHLRRGEVLKDEPEVAKFLETVKDLPDSAVVVIWDGEFSVLVDSEGHVLCFR